MFLVERAGRVMGRFLTEGGDVFFIEPCNNWEGCHVWKHYHAQDIFVQEVEELDTDLEVENIHVQCTCLQASNLNNLLCKGP